jgi:hypothetical protein
MFGRLSDKMAHHSDLIKAIRSNDVMYVTELLNNGKADPTMGNNEGLLVAIQDDNITMIDLLLSNHDVAATVNWDYLMEECKTKITKKYIAKKRTFFKF